LQPAHAIPSTDRPLILNVSPANVNVAESPNELVTIMWPEVISWTGSADAVAGITAEQNAAMIASFNHREDIFSPFK
jgi:hypothetical protein